MKFNLRISDKEIAKSQTICKTHNRKKNFDSAIDSSDSRMTSSEKFCLKWNDFQKNVSTSFSEIRDDFCDVTLASEGSYKIEANKVILAASSTFFHELLKQTSHPHPFLYMRGIKGNHLAAVVDFIYQGEVNILQEDLDDFLDVAKELKLKGLMGEQTQAEDQFLEHYMDEPKKETCEYTPKNLNFYKPNEVNKFEVVENMYNLKESSSLMVPTNFGNKIQTCSEELDGQISTMMSFINGMWHCNECGKANKNKAHTINHIEAKHIEGVSHPCNQCGKLFRSRHSTFQYEEHVWRR